LQVLRQASPPWQFAFSRRVAGRDAVAMGAVAGAAARLVAVWLVFGLSVRWVVGWAVVRAAAGAAVVVATGATARAVATAGIGVRLVAAGGSAFCLAGSFAAFLGLAVLHTSHVLAVERLDSVHASQVQLAPLPTLRVLRGPAALCRMLRAFLGGRVCAVVLVACAVVAAVVLVWGVVAVVVVVVVVVVLVVKV
jgi:hypothetical protein